MDKIKLKISSDDHIAVALFKSNAYLLSVVALVAIIIFIPAGGHPPGIVFVPAIVLVWLILLGMLFLLFKALKFALPKYSFVKSHDNNYTWSIFLAGMIYFHFVIISFYNLIPFINLSVLRTSYSSSLISLALSLTPLIGLFLQKKWVKTYTIVLFSIPLVFIAIGISQGKKIGELNPGSITILALLFFLLIIVIDFIRNRKVRLFLSE